MKNADEQSHKNVCSERSSGTGKRGMNQIFALKVVAE